MYEVKRYGIVVALLLAVVFFMNACGGGVSKGDAPSWYLNNPKDKGKIFGAGASEKTASLELGKKVADTNAQQTLAASIQVQVQSMVRTFLQQSGTMEESRALQFSEAVGKNVVDITLTGVVISKRDVRGSKVFSLAELSKDSINKAISNAARDAAANFSEMKAKSALDALDKAVGNFNYENAPRKSDAD